jgi:hypothetical protein
MFLVWRKLKKIITFLYGHISFLYGHILYYEAVVWVLFWRKYKKKKYVSSLEKI